MVPANPPILVAVTAAVPCAPAWVLTDRGPSIRKSTTFTDMTMECDRELELPEKVPVIVRVKSPATLELTVSVEVPVPPEVRVTLVGLRLAAVFVEANDTTPLKLLILERVRTELVDEPAWRVRDCGLADIVKSGWKLTVKDMITEWEEPPLTPVTVTT